MRFWAAVWQRISSALWLAITLLGILLVLVFQDLIVKGFYWLLAKTGLTPTAALGAALRNPVAAFVLVVGFVLIAIFLAALLEIRNQATLPPTSPTPPLPAAPPAPSPGVRAVKLVAATPPSVEFITCESNVPLMHIRGTSGPYYRLPAAGEMSYAAVAAFRNKGQGNAILTAHLRIGETHVHSVAWVGSGNGSYTIGPSQTAELIIAVHSRFNYYYLLDVTASGVTHKTISYGGHVAELELDIYGGQTKRYVFALVLSAGHEQMKITLQKDA